MKTYLFANWKMYLDLQESLDFANKIKEKEIPENIEMAIFVNPLSFSGVSSILADTKIELGAQNTFWIDKGGYTGAVSAHMYKKAGAKYALVGHSERRHVFGETNEEVKKQLDVCLETDLVPVLCVGEPLKEREAGKTDEYIEIQLRSALENVKWPKGKQLIIAYEPVWAISASGTGLICSPVDAEVVLEKIKEVVKNFLGEIDLVLLYGGSARSDNVQGFLKMENINGVLVGGASSKPETWQELVDKAV